MIVEAIVFAISALGNLQSLSQVSGFSWLTPVLTWPTFLLGLIEGFLPPFLIALLSQLFHILARVFLGQARFYSLARLDNAVRNWYFTFLSATSFWYVLIAGSFLSQIQNLIANPTTSEIFNLLSTSIPQQAAFFLNFILQSIFIGGAMLMLQVPRLIIRALLWVLRRPKTEREIRKLDRGPFTSFLFFKFYATTGLISLITMVYSAISPISALFGAAFFGLNYFISKYNMCYTNWRSFQDGGYMYPPS